ncbi:MAG: hypothetical protein GY806_01160 [Gammaproteobacteria bacterium]|nr:hypothetical protein [Gammaproteobacteria bacterium]
MKKTILATAIATAISGTAIAGPGASEGLYGKIRLAIVNEADLGMDSNKLVFGFKGSEDLGTGMTVSYGIEFEQDEAQAETDKLTNDKSWIALGGSFGKIIAGEYGDFAGYALNGVWAGTFGTTYAASNVHNTSPANTIQYRGGAGDVNFGVGMTQDGSGESATLAGIGFSGDSFTFGVQIVNASDVAAQGEVPAGESGSLVGGSYTMGDITLGLAVGDNGTDDDSSVTSVGFNMGVGDGGNFKINLGMYDADDSDVTEVEYTNSLGGGAYWGVDFISMDAADDDKLIGFLGINF